MPDPPDPELESYLEHLEASGLPDVMPRHRCLVITLDSFNVSVSQFTCGTGSLRLHELPDPLRDRLTFTLKRLDHHGVTSIAYDPDRSEDVIVTPKVELPEEIRQAASDLRPALADAAWYVFFDNTRANAVGRTWYCPDCGEEIAIHWEYCERPKCIGRATFLRCTRRVAANSSRLPDTRTAKQR